MNNLRLLAVALCLATACFGADVCGQSVISLEEIFEIADSRSVHLRPYITAQEEAEKEITIAGNDRLPDIETSLSVSFIGDGFTTARNYSDLRKADIPHLGTGLSVSVTQPIYTGGALTSAVEMAKLKSTGARFCTELRRDNLRFQLAGLYLDIYKYHNLLDVVKANIKSAEKELSEMKIRFNEGIALQNDITRYELLLENLKLEQIKIENTITVLNSSLVSTAGLPDQTVVVPDSSILSTSLVFVGAEWWRNEALAHSPSLKLACNDIKFSQEAERMVRSDKLPKIGLKAAWTMDGPILVEVPPINRNMGYWWVGLGINYNLSSLYKTNKAEAKSRLATREARERYEETVSNISLDLNSGYVRYLEAFEELKTREKSMELAERNYAITSLRYNSDMALITDMLDAANARLNAGHQLVNARINIIYCYYKLLFISGKI